MESTNKQSSGRKTESDNHSKGSEFYFSNYLQPGVRGEEEERMQGQIDLIKKFGIWAKREIRDIIVVVIVKISSLPSPQTGPEWVTTSLKYIN